MHSEEFLRELMQKQLKLSITCALAFLVVLLGLPLANDFAPELMGALATLEFEIGSFSGAWRLKLGALIRAFE